MHALRSLWLTNEQVTQNAKESLVDLAGTVMSINHSELLLNEIDRLNNDSFCACCTCLFFIAKWPKSLNDVWHKAGMRGLGFFCFRIPLCKQPLRYDFLNKKRTPAIGHCFARGFLPNGGHPLVLFIWKLEPKSCIANRRLVSLLGVTLRCSQ